MQTVYLATPTGGISYVVPSPPGILLTTPGPPGAQGIPGLPGADGEVSAMPLVSSAPIVAGMPVAVCRSDGQLHVARADTKPLAFVAGLMPGDVACGFTATPAQGVISLPDWTAASGAPALSTGRAYFLSSTGGITATPDMTPGLCLTRIGVALSPTTLSVRPSDPLQL